MALERAQRRLGGIAGAERPALDDRGMGREGRGHLPGAGRHDADDPRGLQPATFSSTWRTIGQPASGCRTLGIADFMRVPAPAASTTTAIGGFMASDATGLAVPQGGCAKEDCMHPNADNLIATRFDTVIYDLDGTLIDSAKRHAAWP